MLTFFGLGDVDSSQIYADLVTEPPCGVSFLFRLDMLAFGSTYISVSFISGIMPPSKKRGRRLVASRSIRITFVSATLFHIRYELWRSSTEDLSYPLGLVWSDGQIQQLVRPVERALVNPGLEHQVLFSIVEARQRKQVLLRCAVRCR